ncbi:MAG: zinc transporter ZntB [Pseudomonadota bacterium]
MSSEFTDQQDLFWRYAVSGDGTGRAVDADEAIGPDTAFVWVHIQSDAKRAREWLLARGLDEVVVDTLTAQETRPRAFSHNNGVLLVLRGVNMKAGADPEDMVALRIWFTADRVVTARKRERVLLSIQDVRDTVEKGMRTGSTGEFVALLVGKIAARIGEVVDDLEDRLTQIEDQLATGPVADLRGQLSEVRRQAAALRRYLSPQRDALDTLYRTKGLLAEEDAFELRDQADRTTRYVEDLDLARERALVLQEELQNRVAEQQNTRMYVLSIVSAIFLPLSFLTGVFGMNVGGLPGVEQPGAFAALMVSMLGIGVAVLVFMRWKRWL